jgi:Gpi18-like mannosyltransferase
MGDIAGNSVKERARQRPIDGPLPGSRVVLDPWTIVIVVAGLLVRLPALAHIYYPPDIAYWKSWLTYSTAFGLQNVYGLQVPGQTYPPVVLYLLWGLGSIYRGVWPRAEDTPILTAFVKIPAVAGDLAAAMLLAIYASRRARNGAPGWRAAAAIFAFHPALIWLSSLWGQVDILHGGLAAAAWVAALAGSAGWTGALVALGILTKPQGLIIAPAAVVLLAARTGRRGLLRALLFGAAATVVVTLPFVLAGFASAIVKIYAGAGGVYPYLTLNAFNLWWCVLAIGGGTSRPLAFRDDIHLLGPVTPRLIGLALFLCATVWILRKCWLLARTDGPSDHSRAWRLLTLQWLSFFLLPTQIHERYLVPALVSMAPAAVLEKRWRWIYAVLSLGILLNLMFVVPGIEILAPIVRTVSGQGVLVAIAFAAIAVILVRAEIREGSGRGVERSGEGA